MRAKVSCISHAIPRLSIAFFRALAHELCPSPVLQDKIRIFIVRHIGLARESAKSMPYYFATFALLLRKGQVIDHYAGEGHAEDSDYRSQSALVATNLFGIDALNLSGR